MGLGPDGEEDVLGVRRSTEPQSAAFVEGARVEPIRQAVILRIEPSRAFELFTEGMDAWWPVDAYSRAVSEFEGKDVRVLRLEFQPRMGGSILEHLSDGMVLPWAEVIAWDPPRRVLMAWRPHSKPEPPTEVDVTFTEIERGTAVELEHRGWERVSEEFREGLYVIYVRGWPTTLARFAAAASRMTLRRDGG